MAEDGLKDKAGTLEGLYNTLGKFSGDDKTYAVSKWLQDIEDNAEIFQWTNQQKLVMARRTLSGTADLWLRSERTFRTFEELKIAIVKEFPDAVNPKEMHEIMAARKKLQSESYYQYLLTMKELGKRAKIPDYVAIQYIVDGIEDREINKSLLYGVTAYSTLKEKLQIYERMKEKSAAKMKTSTLQPHTTQRVASTSLRRCYNCGDTGHVASACTNGVKCFRCNQNGHIGSQCTATPPVAINKSAGKFKISTRTTGTSDPSTSRAVSVKQRQSAMFGMSDSPMEQQNSCSCGGSIAKIIETDNDDNETSDEQEVMQIVNKSVLCARKCSKKAIRSIEINGKRVDALIDTGSDVNLITLALFSSLNVEKMNDSLVLNGLGQSKVLSAGKILANIRIDGLSYDNVCFHVVSGNVMPYDLIIGQELLSFVTMIMNEGVVKFLPRDYNWVGKMYYFAGCTNVVTDHISSKMIKREVMRCIERYKPVQVAEAPIQLKIVLKDDIPVSQRPRRLSLMEQQIVEKQVEEWLQNGIIQMAITCDCPMSQPGPTLAATCGGGAFMLFMGLLEVFLRSQCDLEDPCGRAQFRRHMDSVYDFIVVGGGSAGSVVAARLSEVPEWRVLLLEAGFDEPTGAQVPSMFLNFIGSSIDWGYHTQPEPAACLGEDGRKCYWPRGKVLGGTSVMNGMMYIRGSRADYDSWAAAGNDGWSYEDVLPYFMKSEDNKQADKMDQGYHGVGGPLTVAQFPYHPPLSYSLVKAGEELGYESHDLNGEQHTGFAIAQTTNRNGSRLSVSRAYLRPAKHRPNLHIMLNATVTRVLINQTTRQAYAVEVRNSFGGTEVIFANNEIILSGGAVGSPQILQLSGVGDPAVLARAGVKLVHKLPAVGRNLHNHVAHFLNFQVNDNNTTPLNWATAMEYLLFRDGLMSGTGISEVTAFINTKYSDPLADNPDIQLFFGGFLADCAKTGMVGERLDNGSRSIQIIPTVLRPKSRGRLEIPSADPFEYPKIYANYLTHPDDVKTLIEGIKFAIRLSETKALKRYGIKMDKTPAKGCESIKFGCDAYWECAVRMHTAPENHQAGSCKMGPRGDPSAVVDNLLQVQGLDRLRVADASVMPAVTSGNTNAPTIMIGERAADFIKRRWLGNSQAPFPVSGSGDVSNVLQVSETQYQVPTIWQRWL